MKKTLFFILYFACCLLLNCTSKETKQTATAHNKVEASANQTADKPDESKKEKDSQKLGMEALIEAYLKKTGMKITFVKKDFANGYAEFSFTENPIKLKINCQFAYYTTQKDREILAVTVPQCMQSCVTALSFYEVIKGELIEIGKEDLIEGMKDGVISFDNFVRLHCEEKMTAEEKQMKAQGHMAIYNIWIDLPQQGTTIKISKETTTNQQKQTIAELQFNDKTGNFKFVKL
jgi:hypothetical protein